MKTIITEEMRFRYKAVKYAIKHNNNAKAARRYHTSRQQVQRRIAVAFLLDKIIITNVERPQHFSEKIFRGLCHICLTSLDIFVKDISKETWKITVILLL